MNRFYRSMAVALVLALTMCALPAVALTAQAAWDSSASEYVIFEETFDGTSGMTYSTYTSTSKGTIKDGCMVFTNATDSQNSYATVTIPNLDIPILKAGCAGYPAIKIELTMKEATGGQAMLQVSNFSSDTKTQASTNDTTMAVDSGSFSIVSATSATSRFYIKSGNGEAIRDLTIRIGLRKNATNATVKIDGYKISLVYLGSGSNITDMQNYLPKGNGYFKLLNDMTYDAGVLVFGNDAVLDLNGYNLTIAEDSSIKVPANAQIVDSGAAKSGKITCAKDALTITNSAHTTLPLWTGSGYVFAQPELIGDTHIFVVPESRTEDSFKLQFRPGFGTLGGKNVREEYLCAGDSDIEMSAYITSTDLYGNTKKLQYNGSEEIILDNFFDGMYETATARMEMTFESFEKYEKIDVTIKLTSQGVSYTLPTYTVKNTYVTKHFGSKFNEACANSELGAKYNITGGTSGDLKTHVTDAGNLDCVGSSVFAFDSAIATGSGTLIMDFDMTLASGKAVGFDNRIGSTRYYVFATNSYGASGQFLQKLAITGEKHVRIEIDLATFNATYYLDGSRYTVGAPASGQLTNFISAWNGKTSVILDMSGAAAGACVLDNLMIYTIKNP